MLLALRAVKLPEPDSMVRQLAVGRVAFAAVFLAAPVPGVRLLGTDTATAQRVSWLTRMMAVRDGALGVGALNAARSGDPRPWLIAGAVSDAVDAVVIAGALKSGRVKGIVPKLVAPGALLVAATGLIGALRARRG
jgi:hypothetical protein